MAVATLAPVFASAYDVQVGAAQCASSLPSDQWTLTAGAYHGWNTTANGNTFYCSFLSNSDLLHYNVSTLLVDVYDANTAALKAVTAAACVHDWDSTTILCGSSAASPEYPAYAFRTLSPPLTYWTSSYYSWFSYIIVKLPPKPASGVPSQLIGYYAAT